jgi:hypothetical protein
MLDRALLGAASALDALAAQRMARRVTPMPPAARRHDDVRTRAQALGAIGIIPR